jgi:predicted phage replisome organizer
MSVVKWIKLSVSMFDDEKIRLIESMPDSDTVLTIWIKLLVLAGKTNATGYLYLSQNIPYTDEMLATIFNRPLNTVRYALETFKQFGMVEIDDNNFMYISNWEKHQTLDKAEKIKEQTKKRVAEHRERKKLELGLNQKNVTLHVTQSNATELELEKELEQEEELEIDNINVFNFYQQNFGVLNGFIADEIQHWVDDLNEELVIEAMKRTLEQQQKWRYTKGILANWQNKNFKSIQDVHAADLEFKNRKKSSNRSNRTEIVPDWLNPQEQPKASPSNPVDVEQERLRLEEEWKQYKDKKSKKDTY